MIVADRSPVVKSSRGQLLKYTTDHRWQGSALQTRVNPTLGTGEARQSGWKDRDCMASQLAHHVDWVSLSRKISRQCRDVLGVRLAAEELCRLLKEEAGLLGGRLHLTSEFETIVVQHGKSQGHSVTVDVECPSGRGSLEIWPTQAGEAGTPGYAGFEALIEWMVTDWFRRLEVTFGVGAGGEESLVQLGSALAGAHQLEQLLQMVLQTYVRVSQARGGSIQLIESGWETASRTLGCETPRSLTIALLRHQQVKALVTLFFEPGHI